MFLGTRTKIHAADTQPFTCRSREWTYYDSIRSPLSNSRVQLRGHMSCILVTRMYRLNAGVALELPCGAIPSYVSHPPTFQPRTQRLPLASQEKGWLGRTS